LQLTGEGALIVALLVNIGLAGVPGIRAVLAAPESALSTPAIWFEVRLNRPGSSPGSHQLRGLILLAILVGLSYAFA